MIRTPERNFLIPPSPTALGYRSSYNNPGEAIASNPVLSIHPFFPKTAPRFPTDNFFPSTTTLSVATSLCSFSSNSSRILLSALSLSRRDSQASCGKNSYRCFRCLVLIVSIAPSVLSCSQGLSALQQEGKRDQLRPSLPFKQLKRRVNWEL